MLAAERKSSRNRHRWRSVVEGARRMYFWHVERADERLPEQHEHGDAESVAVSRLVIACPGAGRGGQWRRVRRNAARPRHRPTGAGQVDGGDVGDHPGRPRLLMSTLVAERHGLADAVRDEQDGDAAAFD